MLTIQNISQAMQNVLVRNKQRQTFEQAVNRTYETFAQKYPEWAISLFDRHFLAHSAAPILARVGQGTESVQGYALAVVWSRQISWAKEETRQELIGELIPVAADFLLLLEAELRNQKTVGEWLLQAA